MNLNSNFIWFHVSFLLREFSSELFYAFSHLNAMLQGLLLEMGVHGGLQTHFKHNSPMKRRGMWED